MANPKPLESKSLLNETLDKGLAMDWNAEIMLGLTARDALFVALALLPAVFSRVTRAVLANRNKAASIAIALFGSMLVASQAGDSPITGKEVLLMIIGVGLYILGCRFLADAYREEGRRAVELQENERN